MTWALCLGCHAKRFGALSTCGTCGHKPAGAVELAQAITLTDNYLSPDGMLFIQDILKAGGNPFDFPQIQEIFDRMYALVSNESGELDMTQMREWLKSKGGLRERYDFQE